jgi:acetyl/propionyl-CoA carboxylase alpha subunit
MGEAAVLVANPVIIWGRNGRILWMKTFLFLEMNTFTSRASGYRITGLDLVEQQIKVARGEALASRKT